MHGKDRLGWNGAASQADSTAIHWLFRFFPTARARGTANVSGPYRNGSLDLAGYLRFCGQWILMMHGRLLHVRPLLCHWCDAAGASQPAAPGARPVSKGTEQTSLQAHNNSNMPATVLKAAFSDAEAQSSADDRSTTAASIQHSPSGPRLTNLTQQQ